MAEHKASNIHVKNGTNRALAVGPVAVVSPMTAAAVGNIAEAGTRGVSRRGSDIGVFVRRDAVDAGFASARVSGQFPVVSGYRGLHHSFGPSDRRQPVAPHPWH